MKTEFPSQKEKELFIRYGSAASEAMFDFPCYFFRIPECVGIIAYRIESSCAVVFGDPICPPEEIPQLTKAFHVFCQKENLNIIYITVTKKFVDWASQELCKISIEVCEEFVIDPVLDPSTTSKRLHHRVEHAKKQGLTIHEYIPFDQETEEALKQVGIHWQEARKGPQIYLGHLDFFESYEGKRWFYVKEGERITSMVMLSKIEAYQGWLLKFLMTLPDAMHDTSEFLMISLLDILRNENCRYLSKGMLPISQLGTINGLGYFSTWLSRRIYQLISMIYKFKKRKEYWLRYNPQKEPAYLLLSHSHFGFQEIQALRKAFRTTQITSIHI